MIQFITHYTDDYSYLDSVRIALAGGCRWVQLRMKYALVDEIRPVAQEALRLCHDAGARLIIDDHVMLCKEIGADGVHLGKTDMPIDQARQILGPHFIIGGTANTLADALVHAQRGANYIGCGPFRFTTTKEQLAPLLGLKGYEALVHDLRCQGVGLPVIAIGGITIDDVPALMKTGINGIAISGAVLRAPDPIAEMKRFTQAI